LRELGYEAEGYDAFAEGWNNEDTLSRQYDVVETAEVLEHAEDIEGFITTAKSCVRSGGLLVVRVPVADYIDLGYSENHLAKLHQPYHRHLPSESALKTFLESPTFDLVDFSRMHYANTHVPGVNVRFLSNYVRRAGNDMDVLFERPNLRAMFGSPSMIRDMFTGWRRPPLGDATAILRRIG
jgi:hypothetical protein